MGATFDRACSALLVLIVLALCVVFSAKAAAQEGPSVLGLPRSILVLPPVNNTTEPMAAYSYLATVSRPLVEAGYYVYPVAVIDNFFKENGLPTPDDMHSAPLTKIREIIGADAVLYITLERYGQEYLLVTSQTIVEATARLVDTKSGAELWSGRVRETRSSNSSSSLSGTLFNAIADQIIQSSSDAAHGLSRQANYRLILGRRGMPRGYLYHRLAVRHGLVSE